MPDDTPLPEIPSRRTSDAKLDRIIQRLNQIEENQVAHIDDFHGTLTKGDAKALIVEHTVMKEKVETNEVMISRLLTKVEGEPIEDVRGNIIGHEGGMDHEIKKITARMSNGGVPAKLTVSPAMKFWATAIITPILVASIGAIALIIVALIGS